MIDSKRYEQEKAAFAGVTTTLPTVSFECACGQRDDCGCGLYQPYQQLCVVGGYRLGCGRVGNHFEGNASGLFVRYLARQFGAT